MRRASLAVALCLLLALSGCSFLPGSGDGGAAPGVEDGELADVDALLEAHESSLTESGYSHDITVNQTTATENGTAETSQRQRMEVAPGASQYLRQVLLGSQGRIVAWGNDTVEYQRVEAGGSTQYRQSAPESPTAMTGVNALRPLLSAPYEVVDTEESDGRTLVTLESTGEPTADNAFPQNTSSVDSFDARLVVDGQGRIHELTATAEYAIDGRSGSYEFTYELTSTSDPGVQRPDWVADIDE